MHGHGDGDVDLALPTAAGRAVRSVAAVLAALTVVAMALLWPDGDDRPDVSAMGFVTDFYEADVVGVTALECPGATIDGSEQECASVTFRLAEGPDAGDEVVQDLYDLAAGLRFTVGERVVLAYQPTAAEGFRYQFSDRARQPVLWGLAAVFAVVVLLLGRWRGLSALVGLGASLVVLLLFVLPALVEGTDPLAVAVVGAAAIAFAALYLTHGVRDMTTVALLGTIASLLVTAVLASVFVDLARLSGYAEESALYLRAAGTTIDFQGLVLAGIVIGGLGAIDDMTVTQASAVWQLAAANESLGVRELVRRGTEIGRDHVASTVNTLVLAYAGAAMPLLLLLVLSEQSLGTVANGEVVATEIVRALVGSIGLVAAVPLTTWLAAVTARAAGPLEHRS